MGNALEKLADAFGVDYEMLVTEIRQLATEQAEAIRAREAGEELREIQDEKRGEQSG